LNYEYLEITTKIGCPVNCQKYCPQEVTINKYSGKRSLSIDDWKIILGHIPNRLPLFFSGFCEPFANNRLLDFIEMSQKTGHPIGIYTTLYQASRVDVEKLIKYPFLEFCLHLPDGNVMKLPPFEDYKDNVFTVLCNVRNVSFSIMNDLFKSLNRENLTRGALMKRKRLKFCHKLDHPQFVLLPNGDVTLCCMDFGLSYILGNLLTENYVDIKQSFLARKKTFDLCSQCKINVSPFKILVDSVKRQAENHFYLSPS
jgi:hypothetical protein